LCRDDGNANATWGTRPNLLTGPSVEEKSLDLTLMKHILLSLLMPRNASDVIDQAIRENRKVEIFLWFFATLFVLSGVALVIWSVVQGRALFAILGTIQAALLSLTLSGALRIRKENLMIRMLKMPLSQAPTATETADMLKRIYVQLQSPSGSVREVNINPSSEESIDDFLGVIEHYAPNQKTRERG
jgi:hypothetical protein